MRDPRVCLVKRVQMGRVESWGWSWRARGLYAIRFFYTHNILRVRRTRRRRRRRRHDGLVKTRATRRMNYEQTNEKKNKIEKTRTHIYASVR